MNKIALLSARVIFLEDRVTALENVLIDIATHSQRCKYPYVSDFRKALERRGIEVKKKPMVRVVCIRSKRERAKLKRG